MDARRWQHISQAFDAVVDAAPERRDELLQNLCDGDAALRAAVEELLVADQRAQAFDSSVDVARGIAAAEWASGTDVPGWHAHERVGPWRVLRELGRGGMGVVLLAERADGQFEQRAALKLIKRGMDSDSVQARFLRERQILARLEHPHIARLLDGGIADDGRPYFAMEFVDGEPLLRYCAMPDVSLEKRIALFIDVCAAVQFAHGQLVIHRDIKPSNILVTANGAVKLLDFGIAKLLDDSHGGMTQTVDAQHRPLTPAYAAPEQIRGEPVSTATDTYSLGVVLFELLTGKRPFDLNDSADVDSARRALDATTTAPLPSRVVDATAAITTRHLRGDLDTIVTTAMQRDPRRRYSTVDAFATDLQRYLAGQPISARRDSVGYRVGKFVDRHRVGVAAATLGLIVLIGALVFALWQAREKTRQALVSQQVMQFIVGIFRGADPSLSKGAGVTAQDLLDQGTQRLRSDAHVAPIVRAKLLQTIATTYTDLGLYDRALPLARNALDLRRSDGSENKTDVADSLDELGRIYRLKADFAQSEPLLRDALRIRSAALADDDPAVIDSLDHIGELLSDKGDFKAADGFFVDALHRAEKRFGPNATETATSIDDDAANLDNLGRWQEAEAFYRRALTIREKNLGPADAAVATSLMNLGVHLESAGHHSDALALLERALAIRKKIFGDRHPLVGAAELNLAGRVRFGGDHERADALAADALSIFRQGLAPEHPKITESLNMIGVLHASRRDFAGALPQLREVVERYRHTLGDEHPDTLTAENNLGYVLLHADRGVEAETLLRGVLDRVHGDNGQQSLVTDRQNLAAALQLQKKYPEAIDYAAKAVALTREREGDASGNLAVALRVLGEAEQLGGDAPSAEKHLRESVRVGDQFAAGHSGVTYEWTIALADFLVSQQRCAEAMPIVDRANAQMTGTAPDIIWSGQTALLHGYCANEMASAAVRDARSSLLKLPSIEKDIFPTSARLLHEDDLPKPAHR